MLKSNKSTKVSRMFVLGERARRTSNAKEWRAELSTSIEWQLFECSNYELLSTFVKDVLEEIKNNFAGVSYRKAAIEILHEQLLKYREYHEKYIDEIDAVIDEVNLDDTGSVIDKLMEGETNE